MMLQTISVRVNYNPRLTEAEQVLLALPNRIRNLRPFMQQTVAPLTNQMLLRHWTSKGAAFGHPWAPWAPRTLAARLRKGTAAKGLLRDTDHLFKTLFQARAADNRLAMIRNGLRFQLNVGVPYAIFHQVGTAHMPERQVIPDPLPRSFLQSLRQLLREFILTGKARNA